MNKPIPITLALSAIVVISICLFLMTRETYAPPSIDEPVVISTRPSIELKEGLLIRDVVDILGKPTRAYVFLTVKDGTVDTLGSASYGDTTLHFSNGVIYSISIFKDISVNEYLGL